jgi:hypothetical protein
VPNVSLATRLQLVEFLRCAKFPLARRLRNLPKYTHAAQKPPRPRGLPAGRQAPKGPKRTCGRQTPPIPAAASSASLKRQTTQVTLQIKLVNYFDWSSNMNLLNVIANLCNIGTFILSIKVYLENRRKRKDDADEEKF